MSDEGSGDDKHFDMATKYKFWVYPKKENGVLRSVSAIPEKREWGSAFCFWKTETATW